MHLVPHSASFQKSFAALPIASLQAGETVFLSGSRTGRLMIFKKGAVAVIKEGAEIAKVSEPGAVIVDALGQGRSDVNASQLVLCKK
jgi:CRP-like cAMP-binding protein